MLQINTLRTQTEFVKARLAVKNFADIALVDNIITIDEKRRTAQKENDEIASQNNLLSKEIGNLMKQGDKEGAEQLKIQVAANKEKAAVITEQLKTLEQEQHDLLITLPNLPNEIVPLGKSPEENEVVRSAGDIPVLHQGAKPHWEITTQHNLIDFELGVKLTGAGFPVYINHGAKLQRALINYFIDYNAAAGYVEHQVPHVVNEASAYGTGQLPDKEGQMYHIQDDKFYMIPTAEVPLTNIYRDVIIPESGLPIKLTGYTPCFRREAGSYGKDVRGLNRLHQFDKVEIVQIVKPDDSYAVLDTMVNHVEQLIISLELPYRILRLCGGDMSFASALTYDFEVYSTAQQRWLEVSSVSNFETFQTNRLMCRYKDVDGKINIAHSLNGSSLALPRIVASLLENHQQADGSIYIPKVLQPYMGGLAQIG
jgi:seryl-tRNA synthetase